MSTNSMLIYPKGSAAETAFLLVTGRLRKVTAYEMRQFKNLPSPSLSLKGRGVWPVSSPFQGED